MDQMQANIEDLFDSSTVAQGRAGDDLSSLDECRIEGAVVPEPPDPPGVNPQHRPERISDAGANGPNE